MDKNKYIIYKKDDKDFENILLFDNSTQHSDVFDLVKKSNKDAKIISAGFWMFNHKEEIIAYGKSISLNIGSRKELDSALLTLRFLNKYL